MTNALVRCEPGVARRDDAVAPLLAQPGHLRRGEVGVEREPRQLREAVRGRREPLADAGGAAILPDDRRREASAGVALPGEHGLALVREPDGRDPPARARRARRGTGRRGPRAARGSAGWRRLRHDEAVVVERRQAAERVDGEVPVRPGLRQRAVPALVGEAELGQQEPHLERVRRDRVVVQQHAAPSVGDRQAARIPRRRSTNPSSASAVIAAPKRKPCRWSQRSARRAQGGRIDVDRTPPHRPADSRG